MSTQSPGLPVAKAMDIKLLRHVWHFVKPHKRLLLFALCFAPLAIGFELSQPYLLKRAIDEHVAAHRIEGLGVLAILFVSLVLLQSAAEFCQNYLIQMAGQRSMHDLRVTLYSHVLSRRLGFFDATPIGQLVSRITSDVDNINEIFATGVITLLVDVLKLIAIVGAMLALDVKLTLILFITLPFLYVLITWTRRVMRDSFRQIRIKLAEMNGFMQEQFMGVKIVQLFGLVDSSRRRFDAVNAAHRDAYLGNIRADSAMYAIVEALGVCTAAGIAWFAGKNIGEIGLTVGLVVAFIEYTNKFFIPIRDFSTKYTVMQSAMAAAERIVELLAQGQPDGSKIENQTVSPNPPDARRMHHGDLAVSFRDVTFGYREGEPVLKGISFDVPYGSKVAVVGATGSGKSTLFRLLLRLYPHQHGDIIIDGRPIANFETDELRRWITVVTQDVVLFPGSIGENVQMGAPWMPSANIAKALARVGADQMLARRNADETTEVLERGSNLSLGERQLIAFARAVLREPEILLLDEATAHVDPQTEGAIERGIQSLMEGRTTLVIAHRLSTIRNADLILVMQDGQVVERGTFHELIARGGAFAQLERAFSAANRASTSQDSSALGTLST